MKLVWEAFGDNNGYENPFKFLKWSMNHNTSLIFDNIGWQYSNAAQSLEGNEKCSEVFLQESVKNGYYCGTSTYFINNV